MSDFTILIHDPQSLFTAFPFWLVAAFMGWVLGGVKYNEITTRTDARYRIIWLFRNVARWR